MELLIVLIIWALLIASFLMVKPSIDELRKTDRSWATTPPSFTETILLVAVCVTLLVFPFDVITRYTLYGVLLLWLTFRELIIFHRVDLGELKPSVKRRVLVGRAAFYIGLVSCLAAFVFKLV